MRIEWSERKRTLNLRKHGIDFADCKKVFADITKTIRDDRDDYGEERFITFGLLEGRVVATVHTETAELIPSSRYEKPREMNKHSSSKASKTDWKTVDALQDEDIDLTDNPEVTPEQFAKAIVRSGLSAAPSKEQVTLRLDADVLGWFRSQGKGYQTKINALLRAYMDARRGR